MEKIITNNPTGYPEIRNIFNRYTKEFICKKDLFDLGMRLSHKLTGRGYQPFWKGLYYNFKDQTTPCLFFNTINLGKNPWTIYFETTLPRLGKTPKAFYDFAVKQLAKENCKEIIAISQCAYDMQIEYLKQEYPEYMDVIKPKMKVQLPPQEPLIKGYSEKKLPKDKIVFTIVGADFFRKGGKELLQVFDELIPQNPQLQLNIVSSMKYGDYATHTTVTDYDNALDIIAKFPNHIKLYNSLPNTEVLDLLKNTHVGLLPTWADSFGYSVLESQATGCPVITTDIRALPEVNNNDIGWVISVPKKENGNALIDNQAKKKIFSHILYENLSLTILDIINNPDSIKLKSINTLNAIKLRYEVSLPQG